MPRLTWNDIFAKGTLISFSVHLWRARIQMKAVDLGITDSEEVKKALSLGCHRLAPAEAFAEINTIWNQWIKDIEYHSLYFPLLEGIRFVPDDQVTILDTKLKIHETNFRKAVKEFLRDYSKIKGEMLPVLQKALLDAAKTPESAQTALYRIENAYPTAEQIESKFGLERNFFTIQIPSSKEAAKAATDAVPQIKKVVDSMVTQLRKDLTDKVNGLLELAQKTKEGTSRSKDGFGDRSIASAVQVLERVESLNILDDAVLNRQVQILKRLLERTKDGDVEIDNVIETLSSSKLNLENDLERATKDAQKRLTGLGQRKLIY